MNYISHLRKKANISQQALAKAAGWNQPRLANYEKSLRVPSLGKVRISGEILLG